MTGLHAKSSPLAELESADALVVAHTRRWIETVVIGLSLCPFARRDFEADRIRYCALESALIEDVALELVRELRRLDAEPCLATTLLVCGNGFDDFDEFLALVELADALLVDQGYEGVYQLASFHPRYCFANAARDDPANYTNRSPYPMLHLLREDSVERALAKHPDPEGIPQRNSKLARDLGGARLAQLLARCSRPA